MNKTVLFSFLLVLFLFACEGENTEKQDGDNQQPDSSSVRADNDIDSTESASPLIGRWELVEKRIPDMGSIPLGQIFFSFSSDGTVTREHLDASGIEPEGGTYEQDESQLVVFDTRYEVVFMGADSIVLETNTDGIREISIFQKK